MSLILFNIAVDMLSVLVNRAIENGLTVLVNRAIKNGLVNPLVEHLVEDGVAMLQYANDTTFVIEDD